MSVPKLENAIRKVMESNEFNLEYDEVQMRKMLQLKESLDQRIGCVVVGPSGCGKSIIWKVLKASLIECGEKIKSYVMNPKSMPLKQLLGDMDLDTREWSDGVLTAAAKEVVKESDDVRSWIVCDGDVDPVWIESLNSVLDDNHLLTLPNGERIKFGPNVNFLFETHDLRYASPATISRMGMIFLSNQDVEVKRLVRKWIESLPKKHRASVGGWIEDYFYRALNWVLSHFEKSIVDTTMVGTVLNGLSQLRAAQSKSEFVVGLIRGLGGNFDVETRTDLAREVFKWCRERAPDMSAPLNCYASGNSLESFSSSQPDSRDLTRENLSRGKILVPTVAAQRDIATLSRWVEDGDPFIVVGPEGCGKSMLLKHMYSLRKGTNLIVLHCNAQTKAENVIQKIRDSCAMYSTNKGRVYRPRTGDRLVLLLRQINLPKPDQYGTCMLIAFLQQLITFRGFYDENLDFIGLERVQIVASMNPATTVGRNPLSSRFTAITRIAYVDCPSSSDLRYIYTTMLEAGFSGLSIRDSKKWHKREVLSNLSKTMVSLYEQFKSKFSVDDHRHYQLTPRDLTSLVIGLGQYDLGREDVLDAFAYESQRVFRDRLVSVESRNRFDGMLASTLRSQWGWKGGDQSRGSLFVTFLQDSSVDTTTHDSKRSEKDEEDSKTNQDDSSRNLLRRISNEDLNDLAKRGIVTFEREHSELHVKLFEEVLQHVAYIDRVLSRPGGSMLLIGRSGVGTYICLRMLELKKRSTLFSPCPLSLTHTHTLTHKLSQSRPHFLMHYTHLYTNTQDVEVQQNLWHTCTTSSIERQPSQEIIHKSFLNQNSRK
jgi:dynein heavy chain 2, cytosolic